MAQGMNGAWLALGVAGAVAAAGAVAGRKGSQARTDDRRETIARIPIKGEANRFVEVDVYYGLGGINYFTYANEPRGFYISARPVKIEKRQGYSMTSFMGFSGLKSLVMPAARYSDKAMQKAIKEAREKMPALVEKVCAKNGIEVEQGSMARGKAVPLRQRIYELEDEEGTFTARLETMYPGFFEGVEEADPNVLRLRKGASTYVGGGAAPRTLVKRMR